MVVVAATAFAGSSPFAALERVRLAALAPALRHECFTHLTLANLDVLESSLAAGGGINTATADGGIKTAAGTAVIGAALLRRVVHHVLAKRVAAGCGGGRDSFEQILSLHEMPKAMRLRAAEQFFDGDLPLTTEASFTWLSLLRRLETLAGGSRDRLWALVEAAPWLEYVPVQCAACGQQVADETNPEASDEVVGVVEVPPTDAERPFVRGGWYRGVPRAPVVFEINCRSCGGVSRWFRSSAPQVVLNARRWGRLCGEQEDLRAWFADGIAQPMRTIVPLDWDHVWSEHADAAGGWVPPRDGPARNFAARLDEGIGSWTEVLAVGAEPEWCGCVTDDYLRTHDAATDPGGRADAELAPRMARYRETVRAARVEPSGSLCQARTLNGFVLQSAGFSPMHVSCVMRRAAQQFGSREWWDVGEEDCVSLGMGAS